jgi:hypothetical protein
VATLGGAGESAISPLAEIAFAITSGAGALTGQKDLDQPTVEGILKGRMLESQGWNSAHEAGFAGLPQGIPMVLGILVKVAEQITGIPVSHWVEQWQANPVVENISSIAQNALAQIFTVLAHLQALFDAFDFTDPDFSPEAVWEAVMEHVVAPLGLFLGPDSPIPAFNLFGLLRPGNIGLIGSGQIGNISPEQLDNPDFEGDIDGGGEFSIDPAKAPYDNIGQSIKVVADGTLKELLSNNGRPIDVDTGQKIRVRVYAAWQNLVATGSPIRLGVTAYNGSSVTAQPDIVLRAASPTTSDWVKMEGEWTVPANVTAARLRIGVAPTATSGNVHFSRSSFRTLPGLRHSLIVDENGNGLPDILDGIAADINSAIQGLLGKVGIGDFDELINTLGGSFGSSLGAVADRLEDMLTPESPLNGGNVISDIADAVLPGVRTTLNNLVKNLFRVPNNDDGSDFTHDDAGMALAAMSDTLASLGAKVSQLEVTYTSGVADGDDFERTANNLGTRYLVYYSSGSGSIGTPDGHNASWQASGFGDREFVAILNDGNIRSATDYQRVLLVLGSKAGSYFGMHGYNDIWCRISDDTTSLANITGIRYRVGANGSLSITRFLAGNGVVLNSYPAGSIVAPGPGAILGGEAGRPGVNSRQFKLLIGSNAVIDLPEVGTASMVGGAYRRWGFGGRATAQLLPLPVGQQGPGALRQWNVMDQ